MSVKAELSPVLEEQLRLAATKLPETDREQFIKWSRRYINGDMSFLDFVLHVFLQTLRKKIRNHFSFCSLISSLD
jgi:hypothetical protein